ncbi:Hypothetical_protein [Hexamita inflata]|uniref:Hypothetical_protein n=1 Tax=Hexamita inflata TaxID=28002 RepID=A0AA86TFG0_9EUKA|nr:Hypothetical protein HINF_LOCUS3541 [Hexamita inflata]
MKKLQKNRVSSFNFKYNQSKNERMFVFKPINELDLYFSTVNGQTEIINKQQQVIKQIKTEFSFNPGEGQQFVYLINQKTLKSEIHFTKYNTPGEQFSNVHFCYGKTYFNVLDTIFAVKSDLNIEIVNQLPKYGQHYRGFQKLNHQGGNMFTMNDKLYVHNNSKKLYQLKANHKLKCVSSNHKNTFYYQFCDKVYALTIHDVYLVKDNLSLVHIKKMYNIKVIMALNGVLVLKFDYIQLQDFYYVLNMLTADIVQISKSKYNFETQQLRSMLCLGPLGMQLNNIIFKQIFGYDSIRLETYYKNYTSQHYICQRHDFLRQFYNNLNIVVQNNYVELNSCYNSKYNYIITKKYQVQEQIEQIKVLHDEMITKFCYSGGPSKCFFELGRRMKFII